MKTLFRLMTVTACWAVHVSADENLAEKGRTDLGGLIANQTGTREMSPIRITNGVSVSGNLAIREGVEVQFLDNYEFEMVGRIRAVGTDEEAVHCRPANPSVGWQGLLFDNTQPGSFLVHTIIEGSKNSGIRLTNTPLALTNCFIINNSTPGEGGGINANLMGQQLDLIGCLVATNRAASHGGGIHLRARNTSVVLRDTDLVANVAEADSSATIGDGELSGWLKDSELRSIDCDVRQNVVRQWGSARGGGIALYWLDQQQDVYAADYLRCRFADNTADADAQSGAWYGYGGALAVFAGKHAFRECLLLENEASMNGGNRYALGGGMYMAYADVKMRNCVVARNRLTGNRPKYGAGIDVHGTLKLVNCAVVENQTASGVAIWSSDAGVAALTNCILYFNNNNGTQMDTVGVATYSCVQNGWPGVGNISFNPGLCPNTYALLPGSPCIDAGHPGLEFRDGCVDLTGGCSPFARGTARNDIGAYGGPGVCGWTDSSPLPKIRIQPDNRLAPEGQVAELGIIATGDEPLDVQWQFNEQDVPGGTNVVLLVSPTTLDHQGQYRVRVANQHGELVSRQVWLRISELGATAEALEDGHPVLRIWNGAAGQRCAIYATIDPNAGPFGEPGSGWSKVAEIELSEGETWWTDPVVLSPGERRFYGVVPVD